MEREVVVEAEGVLEEAGMTVEDSGALDPNEGVVVVHARNLRGGGGIFGCTRCSAALCR